PAPTGARRHPSTPDAAAHPRSERPRPASSPPQTRRPPHPPAPRVPPYHKTKDQTCQNLDNSRVSPYAVSTHPVGTRAGAASTGAAAEPGARGSARVGRVRRPDHQLDEVGSAGRRG